MPPSSTAVGGGFAFQITVRPRAEHFTDDLVDAFCDYVENKMGCDFHLIVKEKDNHLHAAVFLHEPQQRSNLITKLLNNPLRGYDEDEQRNFRRLTKSGGSTKGAVTQMYNTGMVVNYLSGEHEGKEDDAYEVLSSNLPDDDDISELEEYLPAAGGLKKSQQITSWCAKMEAHFREKHPDVEEMTEKIALVFVQTRMFVTRDMDIIYDQKVLRQKIRAFVPYFNKKAPGYYLDYKAEVLPTEHPCPWMHGM